MRAVVPWLAVMATATLVGCRGREPAPPVVVTVPERASSEAAPHEPSSAGEPGEAARPGAPVEPRAAPDVDPPKAEPTPPPQAVAPIEIPFSPHALVLMPVADVIPVVLFPDEAAAVRRRTAEVLVKSGVELVPLAELERIEAAAAEGRLVLEGDRRCRAPLSHTELMARYFPGRPRLVASTDCFDDCRLRVHVDDPPAYADDRTWESPPVSRPHDPKAWLSAAGRVRSVSTGMVAGGLGLIGMSHSPPVRFDSVIGIGPWARSQPELAPFNALEGSVAGCAHPDPLVGFGWELRVSVAKSGTVTRCVAKSDHSLAQPAAGACICAAVQTLRFPAGKAGRRMRVDAKDDGGFGRSIRLELVQPGTETWVTRLSEASAPSRCFDAHPLPGMLTARVILALAPDGGVDDVRIEGDITTAATMGFASCLVKELRTVPLPCRPPGVDALQLSLVVNGP
jgi:hypothetical protein